MIRWAWKHRGDSTLHSLLMNPNTPADVVEELCKTKDQEVRMAAELHCSRALPRWASVIEGPADLEKQQRLHAQLVFDSTRKWVDVADALLDLGDPQLRERCLHLIPAVRRADVAGNSQTPVELLTLLAKDKDENVRQAVAWNSQTPAELLTLLAKDKNEDVRSAVAQNSQTPTELLTLLAKDKNEDVRWAVAGNRQTAAEVLTLLAKDYKDVRRAVARNSQTPAELLTLLAKGEYFRQAVAQNSQAPTELLTLLAKDEDEDVRRAVAKNSNTPKPVVAELRDTFLVQICADGCKGSQPSPGRRFLFSLPQCPPSLLAKNFRSRSWLERFAIAGNPSTPEAVLERMARDGNQLVRQAAAENLHRRGSAAEPVLPQKGGRS
ncbi:HEAT repeat domain-containing protein [Synechococcus sp. CCY9201]|uniref:HEAT repeat domain-containing protein n=1 Tax=Synechococcus sp. CCY9201 TaxID=174697 RepID=UPI002B1F00EE|nr:HEAT repeat domain-containing protein [Synechococcus sp. CCY9201]MEA5474278.1 HEAT repeat domain-containing protein [Synechococcus sp. CCY9201]